MIDKRIRLYVDHMLVDELDSIAYDLRMSRNQLITVIIQRSLGFQKKIRNEPNVQHVNKFVDTIIRDQFKVWDITFKKIFKVINSLAYDFYFELRDNDEKAYFISQRVERNFKSYLIGEPIDQPHWKMIRKLNNSEDDYYD